MVSSNISSQIGAFSTFLEVLFSAIVGFLLLGNFKNTLSQSITAVQNRKISIGEFKKLNAFALLGSLLLILPGFFSDIVGLFLQFSFFATIVC